MKIPVRPLIGIMVEVAVQAGNNNILMTPTKIGIPGVVATPTGMPVVVGEMIVGTTKAGVVVAVPPMIPIHGQATSQVGIGYK